MAVSGPGGAGNSANIEAARRRAEQLAEKRREEAAQRKREAEAARKNAEAQQKHAQEAAQKAQSSVGTAKKSESAVQDREKELKSKGVDPKTDKKLQTLTDQRNKDRADANKKLQDAQTARNKAIDATEDANKATKLANETAKVEGKPEPFPHPAQNEVRTGFDPEFGQRNDAAAKALGLDNKSTAQEQQANLKADGDYAKLAADPKQKSELDRLGIQDGAGLRNLGNRLAREAATGEQLDGTSVKDLASGTLNKDAFKSVVEAAGNTLDADARKTLGSKGFADEIANGKSPRDAAANVEAEDRKVAKAERDPQTKAALKKLGVDDKRLEDATPRTQKALLEAAKEKDPAKQIQSLADASKDDQDLVKDAVAKAAKDLPDGAAKTALTDPKARDAIFADKNSKEAIAGLASGDGSKGFAALKNADPATKDAVASAIDGDKDLSGKLDKLGLKGKDLVDAGPGAGKVLEAASEVQKHPEKAIQTLAKVPPEGRDVAARAIANAAKKMPQDGGAPPGFTGDAPPLTNSPSKTILQDPDAVRKLLDDPNGKKAIDGLSTGKQADAERALNELDPQSRAATTDALAKDPRIKANLDKMGITPDQLNGSGKAYGKLVSAADASSTSLAVSRLTEAGKVDPKNPVIANAIVNEAKHADSTLPDGAAKTILSNKDQVQKLLDSKNGPEALQHLSDGQTGAAIKSLDKDPAARDALIDAASKDKSFAGGLSKLGLTPDDLKKAGPNVDKLVDGVEAEGKGDPKGAAFSLAQAADGDPAAARVVKTALPKLAPELPGAQKAILSDPKAVDQLVSSKDKTKQEALNDVLNGHPGKAITALNGDKDARNAVIEAGVKDPDVRKGLEQTGLVKPGDTPAQAAHALEKTHKAAGDFFGAAENAAHGDWKGALDKLHSASEKDPAAAREAIGDYAKSWGDDVKGEKGKVQTLLTDPTSVKELTGKDAPKGVFDKVANGNVAGALNSLESADPKVKDHVIDTLSKNKEFKEGLDKLGVTPAELKAQKGGLGDFYQAAEKAQSGDFKDSLRNLREAVQKGGDPKVATDALTKYAGEYLKGKDANSGILRNLLTNKTFANKLLTDPKLKGAFDKLTQGDSVNGLNSAGAESEAAAKEAVSALKSDPLIQKGMTALGLKDSDLVDGRKKLGNLVAAAADAGEGKWLGVANNLAKAGEENGVPRGMVESAIAKAASHLKDTGVEGVAKSLLTNKELLGKLLDKGGALDKLTSGDIAGGIKDILGDKAVQGEAAKALLQNKTAKEFLGKVGITTPEQLLKSKDTVSGLIDAGSKIADGKIGEGLKALGQTYQQMDPAMREKVVGALLDKVPGLSPDFKAALATSGELLANPDFTGALGKAFEGLTKSPPEMGQVISGLGNAAKILGESDAGKDLEVKFLDKLGTLKGPVGKFFGDHSLNEDLAKSGAINDAFEAVADLAQGKLGDAIGKLGGIFKDLGGYGDHINIAGVELPFSEQGLGDIGKLFGRLVDVLPDKLKSNIESKVADLTSKGFLKSIPFVGNAISAADAIGDIGPFIDSIKSGNVLDIALNGGQLALDVAGVIPGLNDLVSPIGTALGTVKAFKEVLGTADAVNDIKNGFSQGL